MILPCRNHNCNGYSTAHKPDATKIVNECAGTTVCSSPCTEIPFRNITLLKIILKLEKSPFFKGETQNQTTFSQAEISMRRVNLILEQPHLKVHGRKFWPHLNQLDITDFRNLFFKLNPRKTLELHCT